MSDYAILTWRPGDGAARGPLKAAKAILKRLGLEGMGVQPGLEVWGSSATPPSIWLSPTHDGLIVGDVIGRPQATWTAEPLACARALCRDVWGRYVAVFRETNGAAIAMLRDPSGAVEALAWRCEGLTLVASDLDGLLEAVPPAELAVDWDHLGRALVDRLALAGRCPLRGVLAATPGTMRWLDGTEALAWRPADFARLSLDDTEATRRGLVGAVDMAISGLSRPGARAMAELSGGLDSSIVAGALVRQSNITVVQWLHYFVEDPGADERRYARAAARHLKIEVTEAPKATFGLDLDALAMAARSIRPSGAIADAHYDQDIAARARRLGAQQLFTGLAGDTVFLAGGGSLLAADDYWRRPFWSVGLAPALQIARRSHKSVWSVWREAQVARMGWRRPAPTGETAHLAAKLRGLTPAGHAWFEGLENVAPAKARQVRHLAQQLQVSGRTARGQVIELVHPLLAQPVMEMCLSLSARAQTGGGDDRLMAREAFRERLAPEIYARRSKGDLGRHYGRAVAEELPALRELLLDGCLVQAGLLDPAVLDQLLATETLIWKGPYREIVEAVILEQWARSWTRRLSRLTRPAFAERLVQEV